MTRVLASEFPHSKGCYGDNLNDGGFYYAELSTNPENKSNLDFSALGNLGKHHKLNITYNGITKTAIKADRGAGKRETKGRFKGQLRRIDLHEHLARALGFNGLDYVTIEDA